MVHVPLHMIIECCLSRLLTESGDFADKLCLQGY